MNFFNLIFKLYAEFLNDLIFKLKVFRQIYNLRDQLHVELILNKYKANYKNIILPFQRALPLVKYEKNPILTPGQPGEWDERGIREPFLFYNGKKYFLYYESRTIKKKIDFQIGLAIADKITGPWKKYQNNPILKYTNNNGDYDKQCIADPCVIYDKGKYHMWFDMYDGKTWRIGKAYSDDGINWQKMKESNKTAVVLDIGKNNEWDKIQVHCPEVYIWNNKYHMLYGGIGTGHLNYDTGLAMQTEELREKFYKWSQVTTDGMMKKNSIVTRLQAGLMINGIIIAGLRVKISKKFETTYMVFSDDGGKSWFKLSDPILNTGNQNEWDHILFYGPNTWIIAENKFWSAYLGGKEVERRSLGLAYMNIPKIK